MRAALLFPLVDGVTILGVRPLVVVVDLFVLQLLIGARLVLLHEVGFGLVDLFVSFSGLQLPIYLLHRFHD